MNPNKPYRWVRMLIAAGTVAVLTGCSSNGGKNEPPPTVSVLISPAAASCKIGESCLFAATVSGIANTAVTWSLSGTGCSGASCGTISFERCLYRAECCSHAGHGYRQGVQGVGTFLFALYVVSAETLIVTSIGDPGPSVPMLIGLALRQSGGPFSDASLQGTHVFELTGRVSNTAAIATAGLAASDAAGNLTGRFDRNAANVVTADEPYTATYSIAADGRGTIDSTALPSLVFYMVDPDTALLMEGSGGAVQTGTMERQVSVSYAAETLVGQYAQSSSPPALVSSVTATAQVLYFPTGSLSTLADVVSPCLLDNSSDASLHFTMSPTSRFELLNAGAGRMAGGYIISPLRYVLVLERASSGQACDEIVHLYRAER